MFICYDPRGARIHPAFIHLPHRPSLILSARRGVLETNVFLVTHLIRVKPRPFHVCATLALVAALAVADPPKLPRPAVTPAVFARDIQPLLAERCVKCHGAEKQKGGLRLDSRGAALRGGDDGDAIVPGKSADSRLVQLVAGLDDDKVMPPKGDRLTAEQIGLLRAWIDQGADWPDDGKAVRSEHWALQKIRPLADPDADSIDAFIRAGLVAKSLAISPEADPRTLIRRVSFDLLGLPPTPDEVDAFVRECAHPEPGVTRTAFAALVERLLASPHYGERWGRHWLDVVRYTESQGFEYDRPRDNGWHYRDYVIASFNDDKPYDRFMKEQLAGDAIAPVTRDSIIATSLLVCGPWDQAGSGQANLIQRATTREEEMEDMIGVVGQTFLGLTVNCARCHSHKFDPIPQEEYYRIKSVFDGVKHGERPIDEAVEGKAREVSYAGFRVQPDPTRLLRRGDVKSPGDVVKPGALSAIVDLAPDFGLAPDAPQAQRLIRFADWIADSRNPLPARVMVNRVWQYHFGQGLVATPSDFGVNGAKPTHPALLDWLAARFIASGWSVKALHRLILDSAAYRQSSAVNVDAATADADNTLLWRVTPRRLEAEALRDAMLAVSGQLNLQMGGPSFRPFTITEFNASFYHPFDSADPAFNRRTVYRMNINSGKEPLLDAFDCPEPSVKTPRRGVTITPLQALELMNHPFVQRQADRLSDRALAAAGHDLPAAIAAAYRLALSRPPTDAEAQRALDAVQERGLPSLCWALLNSTEFLYVR